MLKYCALAALASSLPFAASAQNAADAASPVRHPAAVNHCVRDTSWDRPDNDAPETQRALFRSRRRWSRILSLTPQSRCGNSTAWPVERSTLNQTRRPSTVRCGFWPGRRSGATRVLRLRSKVQNIALPSNFMFRERSNRSTVGHGPGPSGVSAIQVGDRIEQFAISRCGAGDEACTGQSFSERSRCVHVDPPPRQARGNGSTSFIASHSF